MKNGQSTKIVTVVSAVLITAVLATSAHADKRKGKKGVNIDQVVASLQLDVSTATNLKTLMENHRAEKRASRDQAKQNREQRKAKRKVHRKALLDLLGYEKLYQFEEIMKENRSKRGKRKHKKNKQQ